MDNIQPVVKDPLTPELPSDGNPADILPGDNVPAAPGSKTPPELLLKSLQEERDARKILEAKIEELEGKINTPIAPEDMLPEDQAMQEIKTLRTDLSEVKGELAKKDVLISHPILKDKWKDFEEFRALPDNKGMNMRTAAKAFLVENGLLEPTRPGLEKTTGGPRVPTATGMSADEVRALRENDPKKYYQMLKAGQIKIAQ